MYQEKNFDNKYCDLNILLLRKFSKQRRILSGLPVTKSPLDLFAQCYFLDPKLLGFESYYAFRARYAVLLQRNTSSHSFQEIVDYKNLDELNFYSDPIHK